MNNHNFQEICEEVIKQAQKKDRVTYLYDGRSKFSWWISHLFWDDWLFKACPDGHTEFSVEGEKLK